MIDVSYNISVGNIIEIISIVGGGLFVLARQNFLIGKIEKDMEKMEKEMAKIATIITDNAVIQQRINNMEEDIRDLRKGRGFISSEVSGMYSRHGKVENK